MPFHRKDAIFITAATALTALLLMRLFAIEEYYPYYFVHDMDFVTGLDSILIGSGRTPDHINHTGFGMYLILRFTENFARSSGLLSIGNLTDLANSLSPLNGMAELTVFVRRHSPVVLTALVGFLWLGLALVMRSPRWFLLLGLLLLASQESLAYHAAMVRTDHYSVFFWAGAVLAMALASRARSAPGRGTALFAAGILMGLSFLTKLQSLFYVAAHPVLLLLFDSLVRPSEKVTPDEPAQPAKVIAWAFVALSAINLIAYRLLLAVASITIIPPGKAVYSEKYGMTTVASLSLIILAALLLLQGFLVYRKRAIGSLFLWSRIFTILASGFLAAFLLHFLMFDDPATSWRYLLYDTKMVFLRKGYYNLGNPEYAKALNWYFTFKPTALVAYHPAIFIAHGAALLLLAVGYLRRWVQITFLQLGLCIALTLICVANLALGVRFILRDLLWAETLMNFLTLLYLSLLISRTRRFGRGVHILAGLGIAAIVLSNLIHLAAMPARINANYNRFSWEPMYFTKHVFPGNQSLYTNIIDRRYTPRETIPVALHQATDAARIRSIASFVFPNQCVSLRSIGNVSEFFPVWAADPTFRIESFTPELRGSIVVDNCKLPLQPNGRLIPVWVREHSEYLDKFQKDASAGNLAILTRNDLQILLFSPEGQPPPNIDNQITRTDLKIRLSNGQNSMVMRGYRIDNYVELPQQSLSPRSFFVIRTR